MNVISVNIKDKINIKLVCYWTEGNNTKEQEIWSSWEVGTCSCSWKRTPKAPVGFVWEKKIKHWYISEIENKKVNSRFWIRAFGKDANKQKKVTDKNESSKSSLMSGCSCEDKVIDM